MEFTNDELAVMITALNNTEPVNDEEAWLLDGIIDSLVEQLRDQRM